MKSLGRLSILILLTSGLLSGCGNDKKSETSPSPSPTASKTLVPTNKCVSTLPANTRGGCRITIQEPKSGDTVNFPFTFKWTATGCEVPYTIRLYGDPAEATNGREWQVPTDLPNTPTSATHEIELEGLAAIRSSTGIYQVQIVSFYGDVSAGLAFAANGHDCE